MTNVYRWRWKDGAGSRDTIHVPMKASETVLGGDILKQTSGQAERMIDPSATDTAIVMTAGTPIGVAIHDKTTTATVTQHTTIAVAPWDKVELLCRLVGNTADGTGATAAGSTQADFLFNTAYRIGIYMIGTSSTIYFPILAFQTSSGQTYIKEFLKDSQPTDEHGLVWVGAA
jgi:hypothetical protein